MSEEYIAYQEVAICDLSFVLGDSFSFDITFPFDISSYVVEAKVGGNNITVTRDSTVKLTLYISPTLSATLKNFDLWYIKLSTADNSEAITYIKGKVLAE